MKTEISHVEVGGGRDDEQGNKIEKPREAEVRESRCLERRGANHHDIGVYACVKNQAQDSEENRMSVSGE